MTPAIGDILEAAADEMLEGLQVIDHDWRYVYVNETVARQGRRPKSELLGKTMMESYPDIDRTPLFGQLRRVMDERVSVRMENEFRYPDGGSRWFLLSIRPFQEGLMVLSVDITERKLAEAELVRKIADVDALLDSAVGRELRMAELKKSLLELRAMAESAGTTVVTPQDPSRDV